MRSFGVYSSHPSTRTRHRAAAASRSSLLARLNRRRLGLLAAFALLLACAFAFREIPALFREPLEPDPATRLFGFFLAFFPGAVPLWQGLALAACAASVALLMSVAYTGKRWAPRLAMLAIALAMEPLYRDLRDFSLYWVALFGLSLSFFLLDRGWSRWAGLPLAAVVVVHPAALAVPVYFLWRRQYAYALSALVCALLCSLAALAFYGVPTFPLEWATLREYISSCAAVWRTAGIGDTAARVLSALDPLLLALVVSSLPLSDLRRAAQHRFDYLLAALSVVWLSPASASGGLIVAAVCCLMLCGIVADRYADGTAPLRFAAPERLALLCCGISFLLPLANRVASLFEPSAAPETLLNYVAVKLLTIAACLFAWKLGRLYTRRTVRLSDYRLRRVSK